MTIPARLTLCILSSIGAALLALGCNSGSGSGPAPSTGPVTQGAYEFNIEIANIYCSDGTMVRNGFKTDGDLTQEGESLTLKKAGIVYGRGHLLGDGTFHLSGSMDESGYKIALTLDGNKTASGFSGISKAAWTTGAALNCHQTSQFAATPKTGGA